MLRIHTTFDLLEAHIIVALLREQGNEAWLFDADFVRQDWFKSIAYGGYRIVAADSSAAQALIALRSYKNGDLALADETSSECSACGGTTIECDAQPRRNVFIALLIGELLFAVVFAFLMKPDSFKLAALIGITFALYGFVPCFLPMYLRRRYKCGDCGNRWRALPVASFADLSRLNEIAEISQQNSLAAASQNI